MINLRFVTCDDLISRIIRSAQMGFWASHVEAVTHDHKLLGAHADGGVMARDWDYDQGLWSEQMIVTIQCTDVQRKAFYKYLQRAVGNPYDMQAIAEMARGALDAMRFHSEPWRADRFICSALIAGGMFAAGIIKKAPASLRLTTPRDVMCFCGALGEVGEPESLTLMKQANTELHIGDKVYKHSGDYQMHGEVRQTLWTKAGKLRYVVEHDPGFLHIYNGEQLRRVEHD